MLAACGPTIINITSSGEGTGGDDRGPETTGGSTGPGATGVVDGESGSSTAAGTSTGMLTCEAPVPEGEGGVYYPDPSHTVSGCFDTIDGFACATCDEWCAISGYGECVGAAPLSECGEGEVGLGYDIGCDVTPDASVAWRCVCIDEPRACEDGALGEHDWWFSGCCAEPFGACDQWCADQGAGECLLTIVTYDGACDPVSEGATTADCGVDVWKTMPAEGLGVQCVCAEA